MKRKFVGTALVIMLAFSIVCGLAVALNLPNDTQFTYGFDTDWTYNWGTHSGTFDPDGRIFIYENSFVDDTPMASLETRGGGYVTSGSKSLIMSAVGTDEYHTFGINMTTAYEYHFALDMKYSNLYLSGQDVRPYVKLMGLKCGDNQIDLEFDYTYGNAPVFKFCSGDSYVVNGSSTEDVNVGPVSDWTWYHVALVLRPPTPEAPNHWYASININDVDTATAGWSSSTPAASICTAWFGPKGYPDPLIANLPNVSAYYDSLTLEAYTDDPNPTPSPTPIPSGYLLHQYMIHNPVDDLTNIGTNLYHGREEINYTMNTNWDNAGDPCWIYEDLGAVTNDDFIFTLRFNVTSVDGTNHALIWGMANEGNCSAWFNARPDTLDVMVRGYYDGVNPVDHCFLQFFSSSYGNISITYYDSIQLNTDYALKIQRSGSNLNVGLYEWDETLRLATTELTTPLIIGLQGTDETGYRYVYYAHSDTSGAAGHTTVNVEYLDPVFFTAPTPTPTPTRGGPGPGPGTVHSNPSTQTSPTTTENADWLKLLLDLLLNPWVWVLLLLLLCLVVALYVYKKHKQSK